MKNRRPIAESTTAASVDFRTTGAFLDFRTGREHSTRKTPKNTKLKEQIKRKTTFITFFTFFRARLRVRNPAS